MKKMTKCYVVEAIEGLFILLYLLGLFFLLIPIKTSGLFVIVSGSLIMLLAPFSYAVLPIFIIYSSVQLFKYLRTLKHGSDSKKEIFVIHTFYLICFIGFILFWAIKYATY